jgi:glucosamine kinase
VLSDQGSGCRIGLEGLRAAPGERPGRSRVLLEAVLAHWELESVDVLIDFANSHSEPDSFRLTEVILRCAYRGDEVAAAVLRKQGEELAWLVRLVIRRLQSAFAMGGSGEAYALPPIAFTGSIMEKVQLVRDALIASVRKELPAIETMAGMIDPLAGAVWRARTGGLR